jgi:murein DD-endopeptidase MepM/ murein hydrolase activator NlpD
VGTRIRAAAAAALGMIGVAWMAPGSASAEVAHVVQPGETLWSISAANNLTTRTVAVYNGISEDALLIAGQTINVPTVEEGAAALASAGVTSTSTSSSSAPAATAYGLSTVSTPTGIFQLDPAAATAFDAMRQAAVAQYGIDIYPAAGSLSAYRTYDQQAYLYNLFLEGQGSPANPPGTSTHELGIAVDLADPAMRDIVDQIGGAYGWYGISSEWWHIEYGG